MAMECNLKPKEIIWNIHNVHIYDRHYDKLIEQIKREKHKRCKIEDK